MIDSGTRTLPIGIFDSGIGGLTVFREVVARLPHEDVVYLGDTARVPYGTRSAATVQRYSYQNARFLTEQGIKVLVVACNTVSAVSIDHLRETFAIPVIGVIEPGARAAAHRSKNHRVGVIGTEATIRSGAYQRVLGGLLSGAEILAYPCPLFVPLVEEGWTRGTIPSAVVRTYLHPLKSRKIDALVLGCTHYPLLSEEIGAFMGKGTVLIDSAVETAKETEDLLRGNELFRNAQKKGRHTFYVTDSPERFREVGSRFLGYEIDEITPVDIA